MIKSLNKNDTQNTPFLVTKQWNNSNVFNTNLVLIEQSSSVPVALEFLDFNNSGWTTNSFCNIALEQQPDDNITYRDGISSSGIFYPDTEQTNPDGTYKRVVYSQVKTMFYNSYRDPTKIWGLEYIDFENSQTKRFLVDMFRVYDVPKKFYGEKIQEKSVQIYNCILDNNYVISDDGYGNLYAGPNVFTNQQELGNFSNYFYSGSDFTCCLYLGICCSTPPIVNTLAATSVTATSAVLSGSVNPNGVPATAYFEYGTTISYGMQTMPIYVGLISETIGELVLGLLPLTTYHFRIVAYNDCGLTYGNDMTFTTTYGDVLSIGLGLL